ncbi:MAG: Hpt domain-containing protein, partial [Alphaproteobacteria bacterium]|nr:Hpt domain-containing protein [Alphaproteobacteria bacterium]
MDDLIGEFIAETNQGLKALDARLEEFARNPGEPTLLEEVYRIMHTIKGTCGFLGLMRLEQVSQAAETVLDHAQKGRIALTPDATPAILSAIDRTRQILTHLDKTGAEPAGDDGELIAQLDAIRSGQGSPLAAVKEVAVAVDMNAEAAELPSLVYDVEPVLPPPPSAAPVAVMPARVAGASARASEKRIDFLLFRAGGDAPKAVPYKRVARIERIDAEKVERPNGIPMAQSGGGLIRLMAFDGSGDFPFPPDGTYKVIVLHHEGREVGLVADAVDDIVEVPLNITLSPRDERFLGIMEVDGCTTDIVDAGYICAQASADIALSPKAYRMRFDTPPSVLLVEGSAFIRNLMAPFLSASGFEVVTASSGKEGLRKLEETEKFDLILSDIEMPVMDGFAFAA